VLRYFAVRPATLRVARRAAALALGALKGDAMNTSFLPRQLVLCLMAGSMLPGLANAQTPGAQTPGALAGSTTGAAKAGFAKPVDMASLNAHRGGNQRVHNEMTLSGATSDNTAINVTSGNNAISAAAFSNMSGIPVVVQNSGSNVLIQNAVILNVKMN
jgi:hypothetical protein